MMFNRIQWAPMEQIEMSELLVTQHVIKILIKLNLLFFYLIKIIILMWKIFVARSFYNQTLD